SAAFGAVLVIALGLADVRSWALPIAAIAMAFASVFALLAIAGRNAGLLILILAGLAMSSIAGAATGVLVPSALTGAALLLAADIAVRIIPSTSDIKVGVLTSIIGVPFFLYLIMRERRALGGGVA